MRLKDETRKRFCKNVCSVFDTRSVFDNERPRFNVRANEVVTNVDVFGFAMIGVVDRERFGTIIVGGKDKRARTIDSELIERLLEPYSFLNGAC